MDEIKALLLSVDFSSEVFWKAVCILALGKVVFVGYGGEPFTKYAANARRVGTDLYVITACLTGGGQGYLPTKEAYDQGGFEAQTSRFDSCIEEMLEQSTKKLLDEYKNIHK